MAEEESEAYITIFTFTDRKGETHLKSTADITKFTERKGVKLGKEIIEEFGVYPDISIEGMGRLVPRMMYYWWTELKDQVDPNGKVVGKNFFKRDTQKFPNLDVLKRYEQLHAEYDGAE